MSSDQAASTFRLRKTLARITNSAYNRGMPLLQTRYCTTQREKNTAFQHCNTNYKQAHRSGHRRGLSCRFGKLKHRATQESVEKNSFAWNKWQHRLKTSLTFAAESRAGDASRILVHARPMGGHLPGLKKELLFRSQWKLQRLLEENKENDSEFQFRTAQESDLRSRTEQLAALLAKPRTQKVDIYIPSNSRTQAAPWSTQV